VNLNGIIFYLFVQALGGVLLLCSIIVEMLYFRNYYYFNSNICLGCLYLRGVRLVLKVRLFPFYLQVYQIISLIRFDQILLFILYPKVIPRVLLYNMVGQLEVRWVILVLPMIVIFVSGAQRLKSSDLREFLAWSGLGQLRWIFVSILRSFLCFVCFFFLYVSVLIYLCKSVGKARKNIFSSFSRVRRDLERIFTVLLAVFFMSRLAPFLMFYLKLFLLYSLANFFIRLVRIILLVSIRMFLFYVRVLQIRVCVRNSFYN